MPDVAAPDGSYRLFQGDCLDVLKTFPDASIDAVVTDPPYGLAFMGKAWDAFQGNRAYAAWVETWAKECWRVLKPGGYLLAFSGTRTYHALAWGVEGAGFEIRDTIEWLYLSGFPKCMDVGKAFDKQAGAQREVVGSKLGQPGYSLKPNDTDDHGRMAYGQYKNAEVEVSITAPATDLAKQWDGWGTALKPAHEPIVMARKPLEGTVAANVERYGTGAVNVDGCRIAGYANTARPQGKDIRGGQWSGSGGRSELVTGGSDKGRFPANCITTDADAWFSPYFNVTPQALSKKASKRDRNSDWLGNPIPVSNAHPTVKTVDLMAWLCRLVTPPNGLVLDPFMGSGTTGVAARQEGFGFIGIEREPEYFAIAEARIAPSGIQQEAFL